MDHEVTMTNGCKVMPDGTMKMKDGKEMHMKEGQMMTCLTTPGVLAAKRDLRDR